MNPAYPQVAALIAGLLGGAHCALMCGGIAGALGLSSAAAAARAGRPLLYPLLYNAGRVASYTLAGAIAGGFSGAAMSVAGLPLLRPVFAALAAALVILVGLRLVAGARHFAWLDGLGLAVWRRIAPLTRPLFPIRTPARAFAAGTIWGWLPCGMAYAMLTTAWLTADALDGALLMLLFGLGTLPALLALGAGTARLLRPATQRLGGAALIAIGLAAAIAPVWPSAGAHGHHSGAAAPGVALGRGFTGEFAQLRGVDDPDRLAFHLDHAELGEPRKQATHGFDDEAEIVGDILARHRQDEQFRIAAHALHAPGQ